MILIEIIVMKGFVKVMKIFLLSLHDRKTMLLNHDDIGLASIASYTRENGYDVKLVGCYSDELCLESIIEYQPQIIGLSIYRDSKDIICDFSKIIKKVLPDVKIVIGGICATNYAAELLKQCEHIDYAVRGEGEEVFLNLIRFCEEEGEIGEIRGLTYRDKDIICSNEEQKLISDLDSLPNPSRDMLKDNKLKIATISTSRGCYGSCTFCESPEYWTTIHDSKKWRGRTIDSTICEIMKIEKEYGIQRFLIINNSFEDQGDIKVVEAFADKIITHERPISYQINFRPAFQRTCPPKLIKKMKESGLCSIFTGIESANDEDLRLYNKLHNCNDNEKIMEMFRASGIYICVGFININPYSTFDGLYKNLLFLSKHNLVGNFLMLSRLRIEKGTQMHRKIESDKLWLDGCNTYTDNMGYRHIDNRIDFMVQFLDRYFYKDFEMSKLLYKILYYDRYFLIYLAHNKRLATFRQESTALKIINECEKEINRVFSRLNAEGTNWFEQMLYCAETHWSEQYANKLTKNFFCKRNMFAIDSELSKIKGIYYKQLIKATMTHSDYLI